MAGSVPTVMVSSTFYDLREVRHQIRRMVEGDLGYQVLISESPEFPIDTDVGAIENCRRRVERDVDVLVLVVGNRYGSIDLSSGKSVTTVEYLTARAKGIPIYVFVEKRTLVLADARLAVPVEQRGALGALVDNVELFEFIERIRAVDKVWVNGFETADDITGALRTQFAYIAKRGLVLQIKSQQERMSGS
ncbi:MAG TPA: DUF4062 domain-containing protein [Candidatus Elarobacter sp.]|jgi:hypothetical protein|nr:DUF4062 domain-containing protein [Candidatus Elarobacter sp.]